MTHQTAPATDASALAEIEVLDEHHEPSPEALDLIPRFTGTPRELVEHILTPIFETYGVISVKPCHDHFDRDAIEVGLVTGGWSGCEAAISVLEKGLFWRCWWQTSARGGAYTFRMTEKEWDLPMIAWPVLPEPEEVLANHVRAALEAHRQPIPQDADEFTRRVLPPEDLLDRLRSRYAAEPVPPCRVCGGELTPQAMGGGPTEYGCPRPEGVSFNDHQAHYAASKWTHYRPGDTDVMALVEIVEVVTAVIGYGPTEKEEG